MVLETMTPEDTRESQKLVTTEFLALNAMIFVVYCNLAVFFQLEQYLGTLGIAPSWFGILIGLFSLAVLIIRPVISPFLRPDNAGPWIMIGAAMVIAALVLYNAAGGPWSMAVVRTVHGAAYVLLATALLSRIVASIPPDRSAQAFGLISVLTLLPYAVLPPLVVPLTAWLGGFDNVLNAAALLMVPIFPLMALVKRPETPSGGADRRIRIADLKENLRDRRVWALLFQALMLWAAFTPLFYFLKGYGDKIGVSNPGWFFTLSTGTEILVRLAAGPVLDKYDKPRLLAGSLAWLAFCYIALVHVGSATSLYLFGILFGIGWGVAMPVLSGLIFDVSQPRFRALNTNLSMEMFQLGFFAGPVVGGAILVRGGYSSVYYVCAAMALCALVTVPLLRRGEEGKEV
jgi:predicted MFS family arabinose efflux permease